MSGRRLTISVLGTTVLDVVFGPVPEQQQAKADQPEGEAPGPVTDRRASPTLGFASRRERGQVTAHDRDGAPR